MELRAEIDRGEVLLKRPALDKDGKKKWHPPVNDRPTLTLYARVGDHEVALCRWPTTIGGWKTIQKSDGTMALKYKESVTGDALWPEDYVRHLKYQGHEVDLKDDNKGYRFRLTPPVPVTVLDGDVRGNAKAVKGLVPVNVEP